MYTITACIIYVNIIVSLITNKKLYKIKQTSVNVKCVQNVQILTTKREREQIIVSQKNCATND